MFERLSKWFERFVSDESGFMRIYRDRDKGDGGGGDLNPNPDPDPNPDDDPNPDPDPDPDPLADFDDAKVTAYLKDKKGVDVDLEKLPGMSKALGELTNKHDTTVRTQKALRLALEKQGINYDSLLADGLDLATGADDAGKKFGGGREPDHFRDMAPETRQKIEATYDYYFQRQMKTVMPSMIKGILQAIDDRDLDKEEASYEESNEDYAKHKDGIKAYREKHGISSRSKETREWLLKQVMGDIDKSVEALAGNEDTALKRTERGAPPPGGSNRKPGGKGQTALDRHRKRWDKAHPVR